MPTAVPPPGPATPARPPTSAELAETWRPYIETCVGVFGPRRRMSESDFPVDEGMCGHAVL